MLWFYQSNQPALVKKPMASKKKSGEIRIRKIPNRKIVRILLPGIDNKPSKITHNVTAYFKMGEEIIDATRHKVTIIEKPSSQ